jgi:tRNA threonylcarbamoyladenosine biosynthesis protein TsaB
MAFGRNKACVGVSTLHALAYNLRGFEGIICPVMNARRSQVYTAIFESDGKTLTRLCDDEAIAASELDEKLAEYGNGKKVYLCGDGINVAISEFKKTAVEYTPEEQRYQSAYSVSQVALEQYKDGKYVSDAELTATYLRLSQAERERLEREKA